MSAVNLVASMHSDRGAFAVGVSRFGHTHCGHVAIPTHGKLVSRRETRRLLLLPGIASGFQPRVRSETCHPGFSSTGPGF